MPAESFLGFLVLIIIISAVLAVWRKTSADPPSQDASRSLPANQILHWLTIYVIIGTVAVFLSQVIQWIGRPVIASRQLYETLPPQMVFSVLYFAGSAVQLVASTLWIRTTYKRFAKTSEAWRIIVPLEILLAPAVTYITIADPLKLFIENASASAVSVSSSYLLIGLLLSLLPLLYFGWVMWKKLPQQQSVQAIQKSEVIAWRDAGMHWATALGTVVVVDFLIYKLVDVIDPWTIVIYHAKFGQDAQALFNLAHSILLILMVIGFILWLYLTWNRYGNSINWRSCTLCLLALLVLLFYLSADRTIMRMKAEFGYWYGSSGGSIPIGLIVVSTLGFLLLWLIYGWFVRRAKEIKNKEIPLLWRKLEPDD